MGTLFVFAFVLFLPAQADSGACAPDDETVSDLQDAVAATEVTPDDTEEDKPPKQDSKNTWLQDLGTWGSKVGKAVSDLQSKLAPTLEERAAIEFVHAMLAPDKLGGNDTTFNQNDLVRIVEALLKDPAVQQQIVCGIRQEAFRQAEQAPGLVRGLARRIADNRTTPGTRGYNKHYGKYWQQGQQEAAQKVRDELTQALESEGITPVEGQGTSGVDRELTLAELEDFQAAVETMKAYGDKVTEQLGAMDNDIPHGLSQAKLSSIIAMLPAPKK